MTDALELFDEIRQKAGRLVVSADARANMNRWLANMRESGWSAEDEADYLQAVAVDVKDPLRRIAAEEFWLSACEALDRISGRTSAGFLNYQPQQAAHECRDGHETGGAS